MAKLTVKYMEAVRRAVVRGETVKEWHPDGDGLYWRIRPGSGYGSFEGRRRPYAPYLIGPEAIGLPSARELWREALVKMARGEDPSAAKKAAKVTAKAGPSRNTIAAALDLYAKRHLSTLRTGDAVAKVLRRELAKWADREAASFGPDDWHTIKDDLFDRGAPNQASHLYAYLSGFFNFLVDRRIVPHNPMTGLAKPAGSRPRARVLDDRELVLVWKSAEFLGFPFGPLFQILILTGQRKSEVAEAVWLEFDPRGAMWRLPAERVKNGRPHNVPLAPQVVEILNALPRIGDAGLLFTTTGQTPVSGFSRVKIALDNEIAKLNGGELIDTWTVHDVRRSVASGMARIGVDLHVVERCLNHASGSFGGIVQTYQKHHYESEMRDALERWSRHVERIVTGRPAGNVVGLSKARG